MPLVASPLTPGPQPPNPPEKYQIKTLMFLKNVKIDV